MMHGLIMAEGAVQSSNLLLPAIITAIAGGITAIIAAAPGVIRAIREDEAEDLKMLVRRVYYSVQERPACWESLPGDIQKDLRSTAEALEKTEHSRGIWKRRG